MTALAWSDPARRSAGLCRSRPRPADRGERLARVLAAHAAQAGCMVTIAVQAVEPWSSATFSGSVATLSLAAPSSPALAAWLADLAEADIPLGRDIVADLAVEPAAEGWLLRVLTCADAANG
ncbi:hypothetical protein QE363_001680 [Sphingomonas sp. SORGH_AS870]|uniref:hypothetical protein n=1 Tax=Sphingomonas sp. SORGH_AS_0870 TaxID=3041801 RepID=UPI00285C00E2|nr:hypothetical protein [Sphingomonas sp. SORGH_AS_0870]MDR6145887.1 hypothetical protein [Sphingomonas sp. SORGH_AS_0870]